MKQPDSAANELGDWQAIKTEAVERYGAFQSIKHNIDDVQEPAGVTSR